MLPAERRTGRLHSLLSIHQRAALGFRRQPRHGCAQWPSQELVVVGDEPFFLFPTRPFPVLLNSAEQWRI